MGVVLIKGGGGGGGNVAGIMFAKVEWKAFILHADCAVYVLGVLCKSEALSRMDFQSSLERYHTVDKRQ